ncbi:alpha-L-fucosidase [Chitinophagaceae bacterium LB-8]|uniref:alpha-L-fucosidase n=1 Tax=Paraflavisolibacter caeni TaxID=2982496 RepID=A0A9X3BA56_9BACT|nr:alpha-L-fucosidase [Paraflavisolibacter caeni]MCU7552216.1 alpha-L-fucosidase [Paraflavisolibacter caeni]
MNKKAFFIVVLFVLSSVAFAQKGYSPTPENLKNRAIFQDNKFGVFIHWGIYSMMADGEWVMNIKKINYNEYSKLAGGFYPSKFNAAEWVANIKAAGAKYICITSRHHDGFSMFDTKYSDYSIMKAAPFKRDVLKELADECHKQGIKLHFYYSLLDWGRPDYNPNGAFITKTEETRKAKWETYHQFMLNQLRELLTNYGEIGAIWFDGKWDKPKDFNWKFDEIYSLIHSLQPGCLILNNHHLAPIEGEDAQPFERDLPGYNTSGFSKDAEIGALPLETCETMNTSWGYNITDNKYKSEKELVQYLVKAAGNNANLLLNVGPRPNGTFPDIAVQRYKAMGDWLNQYGETIYDTRGGMVSQHKWGVTTQKENRLFIHILDLQDQALFLPITDKKIKSAKVFIDKKPVRFTQSKDGVLLVLDKKPDEMDYVVEMAF